MALAARLNLRMQKEIKLLVSDPPPGVSLPSLSDDATDFFPSLTSIDACIQGPQGTVYEQGVFSIKIQIPERYPFQPPSVTFATPIYHPNIDNGGRICLDILNLPPKGAWVPSLNISTVLTSIGLLLMEPNPDDGLMCEASREYKYNRQAFDEKARSWTLRFAKPVASGSNSSSCVLSDVHTTKGIQADLGGKILDIACKEGQKLSGVSQKLSLERKATPDRNDSDHKENIEPTVGLLSQSGTQNMSVGLRASKLSLSQTHKVDEQKNIQSQDAEIASSVRCNKQKQDSEVAELLSQSHTQKVSVGLRASKLSLSQAHKVDAQKNYQSQDAEKASSYHCNKQEQDSEVVELFSQSRTQNVSVGLRASKLSMPQAHKVNAQKNYQSQDAEKASNDCRNKQEEDSEIASTVIVSDSEESEDELDKFPRLRLPLRRKRLACSNINVGK